MSNSHSNTSRENSAVTGHDHYQGSRVTLEGARKEYASADRKVVAYADVSDTIAEGEFVALVGPSGCGKTTLLKTVAGLVTPTAGTVLVDGEQIRGPGPDRAMVFQDAALLPWRSVTKNISYGRDLGHRGREAGWASIQELVDLVGLSGFESSLPHQLSGGMQQRVNVARALAVNPRVLLMDEPFAALDAQTRDVMQLELLRIWNEFKRTVVFVTHQIDEAVFLADRVVVMGAKPGRILKSIDIPFGRPRDFSIKRSKEFNEIAAEIWSLIEKEALQSAGVSVSSREKS